MHTRDRPYASVHEYRVNEPVLMRFLLIFTVFSLIASSVLFSTCMLYMKY